MKTKMSNLWKQLLVISTVVLTQGAFAQAPQKMSYQAVIRDNANQLIVNTAIGMQVSILEGSSSGTPVYVETHNPSTNQNGLASVELGSGTQVSGDFTTIDWSSGDYFVKIETDPTGGNSYSITGTSQLLSVPYALYAESTNESDPTVGSATVNTVPTWNGTTLVDGTIQDDATNIGVGTTPVAGNKLTVNGKTATTNLQLTNGATASYVLQSDASGNATWVDPATLAISETDPEVASVTTNRIPKWNGTALADGSVTDDGTNVGVGTSIPADKLHVVGNTRVDGGRIDFRNTGNSIRIGENAGLNDDLNNNSNVFIGTDAGHASIDGSNNVAIGQGALESTQSSNNVAVGKGSFNNNIDGFNNVGLGLNSGYLNNDNNNTFIGSHAGYNNTGTANIFIGAYAGFYETASDKLYIHNSDVTDPLIYGDFVTRDLTFNGSVSIDAAPDPANKLTVNGNTATTNFQMTNGATANYVLQSDASGNATWVDPASLSVTETDPKVMTATTNQIPKWNGTALSDGQITDNGTNIGIGTASPTDKLHIAGSAKIDNGRLTFANTGNSVFIGENSGQNDDHTNNNNVYIGYQTGQTGVVANNNIGIGYLALKSSLADNNVAIGSNSMKTATTAYQNAAFGSNTLTDNLSGNYNVALGNEALKSNSSGSSNVAVGMAALFYNTTGSGNIAIGREAGMNETGSNKLYIDNSNTATPLIWGDFGANILTVNGNLGIGTNTPATKLHVLGNARIDAGRIEFRNTGSSIFIGEGAGQNDDLTLNYNTFVGTFAGKSNTTGSDNVAIGGGAMENHATNGGNVAVGRVSFINNTSGSFNVGLGISTGYNNTGNNNTFIGSYAGSNNTGNSNVFIGNQAGQNETGSDKLYIHNSNTATPLIWGDFGTNILTVNGSMGIGTTTPTQAKLVVNGSASNNVASFGYLNSTGVTGTSGGTNTYSIYASARIAATEFNAFSDARIKKIKGVSDSKTDLATLASIKITDYQLIDSIAKGNKMIKKVIAQELEQVYPQAVSTHTDVIPDIYTRAEITNGYIAVKNNLKAGEKVRLILPTGEELLEVAAATENGFTVASNQTGPVFVYGREVNDFHTVDYEALTTLNISATQELLIQIEALQNKVAGLERENNNLKAEVQSIGEVKRDLEELKRLIYNAPVNTASTRVEVTK